jgi:hypothetical protein
MRTIDGEDFNNICVAHFCGETGLVFEGLNASFVVTVFFVENFDCDPAIERGIPANENDAHASDGKAPLKAVVSKDPSNLRLGRAARAADSVERAKACYV